MENQKEPIKLIMTIVERSQGNEIAKLYNDFQVTWHYHCVGMGTASSELLNVFGFGTTERDIILSFGLEENVNRLMYDLNNELRGSVNAKGIIFSMPIVGISGIIAKLLYGKQEEEGRKEVVEMGQNATHSLIFVTVNVGFTEEVMETAKKAGAKGGTVIHSRFMGTEEAEQFYGITLQDEKEIITIVTSTKNRNDIVNSIAQNHGMHTKAQGITFVLPIEQVVLFS